MFSILLAIIYLSFISLGLPDSILGSAWPSMYGQFNVSISYAGIISTIIAGSTVVSALLSYRLIQRFGTGIIIAGSVGMTAAAIFGFSVSGSFISLCLWSVPYGLGAGCIDTALNNYVALHYKSSHMNWLHCFWGVGASLGPLIMGLCLTAGKPWNQGYRLISYMQAVLTAVLAFSLPLWQKESATSSEPDKPLRAPNIRELIMVPGAKYVMFAFFSYCALETTAGMWASSYMVLARGTNAETAAKWASLFFLGITLGRFVCGFISLKLNDSKMINIGEILILAGIILMFIPADNIIMFFGLILTGIGCAPVFPGLVHETPENFGPNLSQAIMGMQTASAYVGSALMPPLFGVAAELISIRLYPFFLLIYAVLIIISVNRLHKVVMLRKSI